MAVLFKPRTLGISTKPEKRGRGAAFAVTAMGLFAIDSPDPDRLMADQAIWPLALEQFPEGTIFDIGLPKPRAEVLLAGSASAPNGIAIASVAVSLEIGSIQKRALVFGDRFWQPEIGGFVFSAPRPFERIPLTPRRAFGGQGFAQNPHGLGFDAEARIARQEHVQLPNIEDALNPVRSISDRPNPILFGPVDVADPERLKLAGTYDEAWLKSDAPGLARDVHPDFFMLAPPDQRLQRYLIGNETFRIAGMHARHPELVGRLPGFRARIFVETRATAGRLAEIEMRLDTLVLFGSAAKGLLIWHGSVLVEESDGSDVVGILAAYERIDDAPRAFEHYAHVYQLRSDPAQGMKYALADQQLAPERAAASRAALAEGRARHREKVKERARRARDLIMRDAFAKAGVSQDPVAELVARAGEEGNDELPDFLPSPEEIESGEFDLAALIDGADRLQAELQASVATEIEKARPMMEAAAAAAERPSAGHLDALLASLGGNGAVPSISDALGAAREAIDTSEMGVAEQFAAAAPHHAPPTQAAIAMVEKAAALRGVAQAVTDGTFGATADEADFTLARDRFLGMPSASPLHPARDALAGLGASDSPIQKAFQGEALAAAMAERIHQGKSENAPPLMDLIASSGSGLAPGTAPRQDEVSAGMIRAALDDAGARFQSALPPPPGASTEITSRLEAMLAAFAPNTTEHADPGALVPSVNARIGETHAALDDAERALGEGMRQVRLTSPSAIAPEKPLSADAARRFGDVVRQAVASGVNLAGRDCAGADLAGIDLSGQDLRGSFFEGANLAGARFDNALCEQAVFTGANLERVSFAGASLDRANLSAVRASDADFSGARLSESTCIKGMFERACFAGAALTGVQFLECALPDCDLTAADLVEVAFLNSDLTRLSASRSRWERCNLLRCKANGASLAEAKLFRTTFVETNLVGLVALAIDADTCAFVGGLSLAGATFRDGRMRTCGLRGADLSGTDFDGVITTACDFGESNMTAARLRLGTFRRALFARALLVGVDAFGGNFLGAQLRNANLSGALFRSANLYGADLDGANLAAADLDNANVANTLLKVAADAP